MLSPRRDEPFSQVTPQPHFTKASCKLNSEFALPFIRGEMQREARSAALSPSGVPSVPECVRIITGVLIEPTGLCEEERDCHTHDYVLQWSRRHHLLSQ